MRHKIYYLFHKVHRAPFKGVGKQCMQTGTISLAYMSQWMIWPLYSAVHAIHTTLHYQVVFSE